MNTSEYKCQEAFNGTACGEAATELVWWRDERSGEIRQLLLCDDDARDYSTWRAGDVKVECEPLPRKIEEPRVPLRYYEFDEEPELV